MLIEQKHKKVYTTSGNRHFNIYIYIEKNTLIILIDLEASANFISIKTVFCLKLKTELKQEPYRLFIINRENINKEDGLIYIEIEEFYLIYNKTKYFETI
jgi:hypothetical protein